MAEARSGVRRTATLPHGEANFLPRGRVRRALLGPSQGSGTCASPALQSNKTCMRYAREIKCFRPR